MWTGESEGLFSCIAFLGRRLRLSRWESSRRSRVRGGYAHFLYCHLSDVLRAHRPLLGEACKNPSHDCKSPPFSAKPARVLRTACISPLLGEACKGASHRLHIPPKGETEKERAKPITKFSACISFQEGKIKKGGKPPFYENIKSYQTNNRSFFCLFGKPRPRSCQKLRISSPITEVSFAYFSFQRKAGYFSL